jgi:hypothetical protein
MASHQRHGKEKEIDRSSPWSEYEWDARGFWVSSRSDHNGAVEYHYRYPEQNPKPPTSTFIQSPADPRTPGNTSGSLISSSFNQENTGSVGTTATWAAPARGNSGYDRGSSQGSASPDYTTQAAYATNIGSSEIINPSAAQSFDSSEPDSSVGFNSGTTSTTPYNSYGAAAPPPGSSYTVPLAGLLYQQSASTPYAAYGAGGMSPGGTYNSFGTDIIQDFSGLSISNTLPKIDEHLPQGNSANFISYQISTLIQSKETFKR